MEASPITYSEAEQQQQPTSPLPPAGPNMQRIVSLLPHTPIEQLIEDHPFAVACVDRWHDIFVVFHNWLTDKFNVLKLPQRYHEPLAVLLQAIKEQNVQDLYIENLGTTFNGVLHHSLRRRV